MHDGRTCTLAQDEASCAVLGMCREATHHGGVDRVLALKDIPQAMLSAARQPHGRAQMV